MSGSPDASYVARPPVILPRIRCYESFALPPASEIRMIRSSLQHSVPCGTKLSAPGRKGRHLAIAGITLLALLTADQRWAVAQAAPSKTGAARTSPEEAMLDQIFAHRTRRAPSLDGGLGWINSAGPVDLKDLRGKFVLIDFWAYCCINCMHELPELKTLERAYPNDLVVVGVHSAKFEAEKDSQNITDAVLRYEIEHPVVNDARQLIWNRYDVTVWPTIVLIDPEGYIVYQKGTETKADVFDHFLKYAIPYYRNKGLLKEGPVHFDLERYRATQTPLRYPGKIVADEKGGRLFISDSNHNRIVVATLDGKLQATVGTGVPGSADGEFVTAQFNRPQGMALRDDVLYVADTENHLIRKVDLQRRRVATIAGTGQQADNGWPGFSADALAARRPQRFVGPPRTTPLSSPWDLCIQAGDLYIAMAGTHQIWRMPLDELQIGPYAGNSREDIVDGPLLPRQPNLYGFASFAQPSGLTSDGKRLYTADSEGSSIREVPLAKQLEVHTLIGTAALSTARLFTFGDVDGPNGKARLQHPIGIAWAAPRLYIADTFNNKIKVLDPTHRTIETFAGSGQAGQDDAPGKPATAATFNEPSGLAIAAGRIFVADTNNHAIRTIELSGDHQVATLTIAGLKPPAAALPEIVKPDFSNAQQVAIPPARVKAAEGAIRLAVKIELPAGYKINPLAPMRYLVDAAGAEGPVDRAAIGKMQTVATPAAEFEVRLPVARPDGEETLKLSMNYYYCQEGNAGLCKIGSVVWTIPLQLDAAASDKPIPVGLTVKE